MLSGKEIEVFIGDMIDAARVFAFYAAIGFLLLCVLIACGCW